MESVVHDLSFKKNLRLILADGLMTSLMVGLGESYLIAFILALGHGEVKAGLFSSIPLLAGAVIQLIVPFAVNRLQSHKKWVLVCARLQSFIFMPLVIMALWGSGSLSLLFILVSLYWACALGQIPAWNTWMGTVVPRDMRARYFAWRTGIGHGAVFVGIIVGGLILQAGDGDGVPFFAFALIFSLAGICRFEASRIIERQMEGLASTQTQKHISLGKVLRKIRKGTDGKLLHYMIWLNITVQVSAPFFTPYMLKELNLSYLNFMILVSGSFLAKLVLLPFHGYLAHRFGALRLLRVAAVAIVPLPVLWIVSDSIPYLFVCQILAGAAWAAYELGIFLLYYETLHESERTSLLTSFNLINSVATVIGAALGGWILNGLGHDRRAYAVIFIISFLARGLTVLLVRKIRPEPDNESVNAAEVLAVVPSEAV